MIRIDKEFQSLIPALTADEYQRLKESCVKEGIRDALVVWPQGDGSSILVDGHNRWRIIDEHGGMRFKVIEKHFASRDEAKLWMMKNQLARRNLNDFQRIEIVRKCEGAIKEQAKERQATSTGGANPQLKEKFPEAEKTQARDQLGAMAGVSGKTYEHATEVMDKAPEPVVDAVRKNELSINAAHQVTKLEPEAQQKIADRLENIDKEPEETRKPRAIVSQALQQHRNQSTSNTQDVLPSQDTGKDAAPRETISEQDLPEKPASQDTTPDHGEAKRPHVANNSGNNEWYTPFEYIQAARMVMGSIDLDPASSAIANKTVGATTYYTAETNGLDKTWSGNIWLNPPYASDLIGKFADKLLSERNHYFQATVLVNNSTETRWFKKIISIASAVCFPEGRVKFLDPYGEPGAPLQGQAIIYIGENVDGFLDAFSGMGWVAVIHGV